MIRRDRLILEVRRARGPLLVLGVLAVCAVIVSGVLVANQTFKRPWERYDDVHVAFDDVKGVVPGQQEVRVAGVKVGLVTKSELRGDRAVLTLSIRHRYAPVYRDATFRLRPKTPLQDMYVEMKRGTPGAGVLNGQAVVPATQTVTPVDVSRVLQTFNGETSDRLRGLLAGFGAGLADRGAQLRAAFVELAPFLAAARDIADELALRRRHLATLVSSTGGLMGELGRRDRELASAIQVGDRTLASLAKEDVPLRQTLAQLPATVESLRDALTQVGRARQDLDPALGDLLPVARKLGPSLTALDKLSSDLRPAASKLRPAVDALVPLADILPRTGNALAGSTRALRPQVPDVDRAVRILRACETPFARFFSWTLSVIKLRDAYSSYPRGNITGGFDTVYNNTTGLTGMTKPPNCSALPDKVR